LSAAPADSRTANRLSGPRESDTASMTTAAGARTRGSIKRLMMAWETLGVRLLDDVILPLEGYYSFFEHGEL
jgi:hypothetical protein